MKKDHKVFLKHILDSINYINEYTSGKSLQEFLNSIETQDAVMRRLAVIGEAAKNLPIPTRERHKVIDWKAVIGLKNILVHEYFGIDMKVLWNIIKKDLPHLKSEVAKMLKKP